MYLAFHAIKNHMDIDSRKEKDKLNRIDKRVRRGLPADDPEPEPQAEEEVKTKKSINVYAATSRKKVELVEELPPRPTDENKDMMEKYGRYWNFVNFFSEEEEYMNLWRSGADALLRVNKAVVVDIDDHILLQGFKTMRLTATQI